MRLILAIFILTLHSSFCLAQKVKDWEEIGDEANEAKNYPRAAQAYSEAMMLDSSLFDLSIKYANALRLSRNYKKALYYYEKAYTKDRGQLFPEGQFYIAQISKRLGKYRDAQRLFKKFRTKARRMDDEYFLLKTEQEIESCTFALKARRDSSEVILEQLNNRVNSTTAEWGGDFDKKGLFYFSHGDGLSSQIARIDLQDTLNGAELEGLFQEESAISRANFSLFPNGDKAVFSKCSDGLCDLYIARKENGKWIENGPLDGVNQNGYTTTMPHLVEIDGQLILFCVSDRNGGQGKMDIWWSQEGRNGFERPINAGPDINSIENEVSPFYLDGSLYFSSDWHVGFGGFDIFKSSGKPRSFGQVENIGYPFNSQANDLYWRYFPERDEGFVSSNREGAYKDSEEVCCNDIYRFAYADTLEVKDQYESLEELNDYLPVSLYFHNDEPDPRTLDTITDIRYDEAYESYIKRLEEYRTEVQKGLNSEDAELAVFETEEFFSLYVDKGMEDLKKFSELLLVELEKGTEVELSVKGFASPRAKTDYNLNLTKRRISSLLNYLKYYDQGVFLPYFQKSDSTNAQLRIVEIPFGEYQADQNVSDVLDDERGSIYSRSACLERKIEIQSVQRAPEEVTRLDAYWEKASKDLGRLRASEGLVSFSATIFNKDSLELEIIKIESECDCTSASIENMIITANDSAELSVEFDPKGISGMIVREILVWIKGRDEPLVFSFTAEVIAE